VIKVALVGDSHADESGRLAEHDRIMEWIGQDAAERGVSLFLHSGDIWERRSTSRERISVADWVRSWTEHAPLVAVAGNHDDVLDVEWLGRLRTRNPVHAVTVPQVVEVAGVSVACLPWPRKSNLLASGGAVSLEESNEQATRALLAILAGLGEELDRREAGPRLLLSHAQVRGCRVSHAQPPLVGCAYELGLADLALAAAQFYALGHIHLGPGNEWDAAGAPVVYPGSPRRCTYGETEEKGYVVITFDGNELVGWERVATPATPMVLIETEWAPEHIGLPGDVVVSAGFADFDQSNLAGAEVRFRYNVASEHRGAARAAAQAWREQALSSGQVVSVKVEEVVESSQRARAPEVATARTLQEQLDAYWASKGFDPGSRREALLSKLSELEVSHETQ
jgi:DNA repair exonuclease SbcCD nuclease subunit